MSLRCPPPFKAFFETSAGYVSGLAGKAGRVLLFVSLVFSAYGCQQVLDEVKKPPAVESSVVYLHNAELWTGSGVVVGKRNTPEGCKVSVLTAGHVASNADALELDDVKAFSIAVHPNADIAYVVFVFQKQCAYVRHDVAIIALDKPAPLDTIVHVGYPRKEYMIGYATYIGPAIVFEDMRVEAITSVAGPGSSGGGIFFNGRLIGILVVGEGVPPFRNYYTPVQRLFEIVPELNVNA